MLRIRPSNRTAGAALLALAMTTEVAGCSLFADFDGFGGSAGHASGSGSGGSAGHATGSGGSAGHASSGGGSDAGTGGGAGGRILWRSDLSAVPNGQAVSDAFPLADFDTEGADYLISHADGCTVTVRDDEETGKRLDCECGVGTTDPGEPERAQVQPTYPLEAGVVENDDFFVGFDVKFGKPPVVTNRTQVLLQVRSGYDKASSIVEIQVDTDGGKVLRAANPFTEDHVLGPPKSGWSRIVLGIHLSQDPALSWVAVWIDGAPVLKTTSWASKNSNPDDAGFEGRPGGTLYEGTSRDLIRIGLLRTDREVAADFEIANMVVATTKESAGLKVQ